MMMQPLMYTTGQTFGIIKSASQSAPELINQYITYTNSFTGKFPGSLHIGTMVTQFPVT